MRILSTVVRNYYNRPGAIEPLYLAMTHPLRQMGHPVDHFDHVRLCGEIGPDACGEQFLQAVKTGGYDVVLYQTGGADFMARSAIAQAKRHAPIVAWNSDDDWQWESYTRHIASCFTFMATTYPHIYDANRKEYGNLLLSQWAALDLFADHTREKDLDFTFAGQIYRNRVPELRTLWREAGLKVFGMGSLRVKCRPMNHRGIRDRLTRWFPSLETTLDFQQINDIWNRTKISYTPMSASTNPSLLQIKSRAFEMGLSWTMMLCQPSPNLERYYEPGKEFVPFVDLKDCMEKAKWYLDHTTQRQAIAQAYYDRTRAEHLWEHRWNQIFDEIGVGRRPSSGSSRNIGMAALNKVA